VLAAGHLAYRLAAGPRQGQAGTAEEQGGDRRQGVASTHWNSGSGPRHCSLGGSAGLSHVRSVDAELASGEVQRLLPDWDAPANSIHLVSPPQRRHSAKVAAFTAFVIEALEAGR
jgi:DNA-binding transcriptional LysR family regulator